MTTAAESTTTTAAGAQHRPSPFSSTDRGFSVVSATIIAAVGLFLVAWQQPQPIYATAFSVERGLYGLSTSRVTKAVVAFASCKDDNKGDPNSPLVSDLGEKERKSTSLDTTTATAAATAAATTTTTTATFETTENFSNFATNKTPLLAELLSLAEDNTNDDEDDGVIRIVSPPTLSSSIAPSSGLEDSSSRQLTTSWKERSSELAVVALATCALAGFLGDALLNYEWVQTLRYFWPLSLGVYYGLLWNTVLDTGDASWKETAASPFSGLSTFQRDDPGGLLLRLGYVFGGFGLFFGGLADAVLPVWMTGPNWITNAGLAPDCAVLLLFLTLGEEYYLGTTTTKKLAGDRENSVSGLVPLENNNNNGSNNGSVTAMTPLLLRIALYAELYKLGESSLDEVVSGLQTLLSSST